MDGLLTKLIQQSVLFAPRFVASLVIFVVFWLIGDISKKVIQRVSKKSKINPEIIELTSRVVKITLLLFGGVTALGTLGINVSALVASLGLTGFALGFALRDAISNLLAGVLIMVYRPLKTNDQVAVTGFEGTVTKIDLRYTTLVADDTIILIPNATLFTCPIKIMGSTEDIVADTP